MVPRIDHVPASLSLYRLVQDHLDTVEELTGRRPSYQEALLMLDGVRDVPWRALPARPCGCGWCRAQRDAVDAATAAEAECRHRAHEFVLPAAADVEC